ncbi:MAG: tRNA isopentenyl-2-thiomethyl-A-37 hydroxylase MiaE [Deltaproteobacteria bacterium]|nr:tRNA isopentenyl-2-thiomethyl-A-37 hydroxylase MiaE [Deltaproteobacteria bacterium]
MLGLLAPTHPDWIDAARSDLDAVLHDHLHCELKAASNATALVARYPMFSRLVRTLSELAREELTHVQQVYAELEARGFNPRPPGEDPYAGALRKASLVDTPHGDLGPLLDRLTVGALIEARSCERFSLLRDHAPTEPMRAWYGQLFISEAQHYRLFASLAEEIAGESVARKRLQELAVREAEILKKLPISPRIH